MFVASCALLLAAANGFYAPATRHPLARAKPLQAAKEGVAAAGEKQRIARRSVVKSGQPSKFIEIHGDTQKTTQQFNPHTHPLLGAHPVVNRLFVSIMDSAVPRRIKYAVFE